MRYGRLAERLKAPVPKTGGLHQGLREFESHTFRKIQNKKRDMKFLAQTIGGQIVHDFTFALQRAKEHFDWEERDTLLIDYHEGADFSDVKSPDEYVPVGSVEYVSAYLRAFYPKAVAALKPLNVPAPLLCFASARGIKNILNTEDAGQMLSLGGPLYRKNLDIFKHPLNGICIPASTDDIVGYQVSRVVDFVSEWRVLVHRGIIQYVANYAGSPLAFPDADLIIEMVKEYDRSGTFDASGRHSEAPVAYTLDVGVTSEGNTQIIECHRFFSCGLYGYNEPNVAYMLSQAWFEIKNN